jgi:hypothetical protein
MSSDVVVEQLIFGGRYSGEPVPPGSLLAYEETVEQPRRSRVVHHLGEILAADLVDVVDSDICGNDVVARRPMRSLPLDALRRPASQPIVRL